MNERSHTYMTRTTKGASIIELIISLGVFSTILVSLAMIMNAGYEQYWVASGSLEVQQAALTGTSLLVKELEATNMTSVEVTDDTATPPLDSVVFALLEDPSGSRSYNLNGVPKWQSFVAYFIEDVGNESSLIRTAAANSSPSVNVPIPSDSSMGIGVMRTQPSPRMMLKGVEGFDLEKREDLVKIELTAIFEQRGTFSITVRNQAFPRN